MGGREKQNWSLSKIVVEKKRGEIVVEKEGELLEKKRANWQEKRRDWQEVQLGNGKQKRGNRTCFLGKC